MSFSHGVDKLLEITLPVVDCQQKYSLKEFITESIPKQNICLRTEEDRSGSCPEGSGQGPIIFGDGQIGIVNWDSPCMSDAKNPVYTSLVNEEIGRWVTHES